MAGVEGRCAENERFFPFTAPHPSNAAACVKHSSFELDFTKKFKCTICPYFSCSSISLDQGWSDGFDLAQRLEVTKPTTKPMIMAKMAAQDVDKAKVRSEYTG